MAKAASAATMNAESDDVATVPVAIERRPGALLCPDEGEVPHLNTQVYSTKGSVQYCKCNDCGKKWSRPRPENAGGPSNMVMLALADTLDASPQVQYGSQMVIMVQIDEAKRISRRIREICQA